MCAAAARLCLLAADSDKGSNCSAATRFARLSLAGVQQTKRNQLSRFPPCHVLVLQMSAASIPLPRGCWSRR